MDHSSSQSDRRPRRQRRRLRNERWVEEGSTDDVWQCSADSAMLCDEIDTEYSSDDSRGERIDGKSGEHAENADHTDEQQHQYI